MPRLSSLEDVEQLYTARGGLHYGEGVTQLEHALQCAALAERAGASPSLVIAALLHDIGHLLEDEAAAIDNARDGRHETAGAAALAKLFDEVVFGPVALHVSAKRYLCFKDAQYYSSLSDASRRSLALQGGAYGANEAAAFEQRPYWREAVTLRRFDDAGKSDVAADRSFADFVPLMHSLLKADRNSGPSPGNY